MLTFLAVTLVVLLTIAAVAGACYWIKQGGTFGWYMASQSLSGLAIIADLFAKLIAGIQNE